MKLENKIEILVVGGEGLGAGLGEGLGEGLGAGLGVAPSQAPLGSSVPQAAMANLYLFKN